MNNENMHIIGMFIIPSKKIPGIIDIHKVKHNGHVINRIKKQLWLNSR
jgi:hypothetical protein